MKVISRSGTFYVTDGSGVYPTTASRLNQVAKSLSLGIRIDSKRSPRLATITKRNGKAIQTDRLWNLANGLQEAAEIMHTLQHLDRKGKIRYYKQIGL